MKVLLIVTLLSAGTLLAASTPSEPFDEGRLEKEVLVLGLRDAVQLEVAPNGEVYYIERAGEVKVYSVETKTTRTLGTVPVVPLGEGHMTGMALDPGFMRNGWIYLYFSPQHPGNVMNLSRFTIREGALDLSSETVLISQPFMPLGHFGGGMQFDADGNLWLATGDNANANVTPETDERAGRENFNALGTAANTQDLRGKILRIRPQPDGTYTIPPGNLHTDRTLGRPEIYIMGCRNPYRFTFDSPSHTLYWAEVGSNTEERFGTGGYDEITRSTEPGNSGWPLFIGPNAAYTRYDHATDTIGEKYSIDRPVNESRLNTGLRELPKPIFPMIWYGSEDSKEFPELGNGGRSAMVGFRYRYDPLSKSAVKLPARFDGQLFIYEWCRNWIKTVSFDPAGNLKAIEPFFGAALLRRPIDLKLGPDGAIYLIEFGEKWGGNVDGVLSRIVYRRGNRAPLAVAEVDASAGAAPLRVAFSADKSSDPDGDQLTYRWLFGEGDAGSITPQATHTYSQRGVFRPSLTVTDQDGLATTVMLNVAVGNSPPAVRLTSPTHGGFFDWTETIPFAVEVSDQEDGAGRPAFAITTGMLVKGQYYAQPASGDALVLGTDGGAGLMRRSDCLSCHAVASISIGPSFLDIAKRYDGDPTAVARLADKIVKGGAGSWGEVPMAPHPQLAAIDAAAMAETVLKVGQGGAAQRAANASGAFKAPAQPSSSGGGTFVITASYTDRGALGLPPLTAESRVVLHARRTRANTFEASQSATVMEVSTLVRRRRICVQLAAGGHLLYRDVNLAGVSKVNFEISAGQGHGGLLELRVDSPTGPRVGSVQVPVTGQWENWETVSAEIVAPEGTRDLYVVHAGGTGDVKKRFNLDVLEFVERPL